MYSTLLATSAYWKISIPSRNGDKTELTSEHELPMFIMMHVVLNDSPVAGQGKMHVMLTSGC